MNNTNLFFLRLPLAASMLGHGLVRIPKLDAFSQWMVKLMEPSAIPIILVKPFSYAVPFLELAIGVLILLNSTNKYALYAGLTLMTFFILGNSAIENWSAISIQLVHAIYMSGLLLIANLKSN